MLENGQKFAHFVIERKLGEGGMGAVYLAEDQKLHRKVALKTLTGDLFDDVNRLERFHREAKVVAQVSNAYVMSLFDIGKAIDEKSGQEIDYLVMEYIDGPSLAEYIKEERPELPKVIRLAEKIASGLASAHKLGIVHRDIKPDNILVDESGDPKILDFGLAKPLDPVQFGKKTDSTDTMSQELTKVGKIMGTVSYMSPEQVRGEAVDTRSDIFAFGILLYRMVTGDLPFAGPTQVETMAKILESNFEPPSAKNESIPPELERIISKCLQKDPDERYQGSRDLVVDLRNLRRQFDSGLTDSVSGISRSLQRPPGGFGRPRRWLLVIAAVLIVVVVGFFGNQWWGDNKAPMPSGLQAKTNSLAILGFENKTGDDDLDWLQTGLPEILLTDLAQNQDVAIIGRQRILDCLSADKKNSHTVEECVQAASTLGATRVLSGTFFKLGDKIRIDARIQDISTGTIVMGEKVVGDDPFMLVDSLTAKIAASLNLRQGTSEMEMYATSTEAYKQYHLGMKFFWASQLDEAVAKFEEAIAIDSEFALPYMRMGMAKVFQGRPAEGSQYLQMAGQYQDRLPVRERSLLDAYIDTWVVQNFDQAFTKITSLLRNYPEDAEIRTFYALFITAFQSDTVAALAQLDTVMTTYPTYSFALDNMAAINVRLGKFEEAIEQYQQLMEITPGTIDPQISLVRLYRRQGERDKALEVAEDLAARFPDEEDPLHHLVTLYILKRDFKSARVAAEKLKYQGPDDPFNLTNYYTYLANLAEWEGRFNESIKNRKARLEQAHLTADSQYVYSSMLNLSSYYRYYGQVDSALVYARQSYDWANVFGKLSYPITLVAVDTANAAEARPLFKEVITDLRARIPRDFWHLADAMEQIFEGVATADTSETIAAMKYLNENQGSGGDIENALQLGRLLTAVGRNREALEVLTRFTSGERETTSGWYYPASRYFMGVANEALGNTAEAVADFQEMLRYWSKPEIELDEIKDARERLSRLTS